LKSYLNPAELAKLAGIGFKNREVEEARDPNASEGRLFKEDNLRGGT
jgi:hypothetical protein